MRQAMERLLAVADVRARSRTRVVDGSRVHYLEQGSGRTLVLLHGGGGGGANWFRVLGALARHARVLAPDLPGFGLSQARLDGGPLGWGAASIVARLLDALGIAEVDVAGTSFGGLVALRLAQLRPRQVRRLVLLDPAGLGRELPLVVRLAGLPLLGPALVRPGRTGTRWIFHHLATADASGIPPEQTRALLDYMVASGRAAGTRILWRGVRSFLSARGQAEVLADAELASIRSPTLVLWGGRDRFFPLAHGRRAAALLPRSLLAVLPRAGHSPNWEDPEGFLRCVQPFLGGSRAGRGSADAGSPRLDAASTEPLP
ncbi:MAG TPA: alpha/beta fold hydrolase [Longimicrobiales bacterium]|nr:alpha/beta fold hydrolase [Longimicrobiales bacterium]